MQALLKKFLSNNKFAVMFNTFGNLFGRKRNVMPMRDVLAMTGGLTRPAVQVIVQERESLSHFGGLPNLPAGVAWPEKDGNRLAFLARISLSEIRRTAVIDWLPESGSLLFFYDMEQQAWGFDPKDRGAWAVLHVPELEDSAGSTNLSEDSPLSFKYIGFRCIDSFPSHERGVVAGLDLTDEELDRYIEVSDLPYQGKPKHQISGFPTPVQGDSMEIECQLASNGLYCGDSTGYNDPRALSLQSGTDKWRLLFQFDSDDELDVMWGDCGTIYYWIREQSARSGDFSGSWLVLQCC